MKYLFQNANNQHFFRFVCVYFTIFSELMILLQSNLCLVMDHQKAKCPVKILDCCGQCHSEGSNFKLMF